MTDGKCLLFMYLESHLSFSICHSFGIKAVGRSAAVSKKERLICGLDIGTSKICMLIARSLPDGRMEVVNTGYATSEGMRKAVVVDLEAAAASIRKAVAEAELKSGLSADWVTLGISGDHIQSYNCHGAVEIGGKRHEVSDEQVSQVIKAAQTIPLTSQREIIHIIPQQFILDGRGDIRNPVGLTGLRMDVNVHIVTCESALMQDLIAAANKAQVRVKRVVLQQLASSEAVLTPDERELGAAVIDIGGGTTDIAVYVKNAVCFTSVIPVGGGHFTRDLAVGLRTPMDDAEIIKKQHGSVLVAGIGDDENVEAKGMGSVEAKILPRKLACGFLRDRAAELLELIRNQLTQSGNFEQLMAGAVLTGGGSMLPGLVELTEEILGIPVRRGLPTGMEGLTGELAHPVYAAAVGLALIGSQAGPDRNGQGGRGGSSPRLVSRLLSWVGNQ
jgi:cell division protein FtsA